MRPTKSGGKEPTPPDTTLATEVRIRPIVKIIGVIFGAKGSGKSTLLTGTFPTTADKII